jgi:1-deoxy-D-xylulose-5-phosphate reductoisomerase
LNHLFPSLDLTQTGPLHFEKPNFRRFPCLNFGYEAGKRGGTLPAVVNGANEAAVDLFLKGKISFLGIPRTIERVMSRHRLKTSPTLADILEADHWSREEVMKS